MEIKHVNWPSVLSCDCEDCSDGCEICNSLVIIEVNPFTTSRSVTCKIGLIWNHPISSNIMCCDASMTFISGKLIVQDWEHLLEIGHYNFVAVSFQSTFLFPVS
jgi:hypothetical protein